MYKFWRNSKIMYQHKMELQLQIIRMDDTCF